MVGLERPAASLVTLSMNLRSLRVAVYTRRLSSLLDFDLLTSKRFNCTGRLGSTLCLGVTTGGWVRCVWMSDLNCS